MYSFTLLLMDYASFAIVKWVLIVVLIFVGRLFGERVRCVASLIIYLVAILILISAIIDLTK